MAVAGLILGIVGTITGISAIVAQVITWKLSGPVIIVRGLWEGEQPSIKVWNRGRAPVSVDELGIYVGFGPVTRFSRTHYRLHPDLLEGQAKLGHLLAAGTSATWTFNRDVFDEITGHLGPADGPLMIRLLQPFAVVNGQIRKSRDLGFGNEFG